jgi:hypothetical protein
MHRLTTLVLGGIVAASLSGCVDDTTSPGDRTPPAAPRGLYSVTGDHSVTLHWLYNTEGDVQGYRAYVATCADPSCSYTRVGTITYADSIVITGLSNGITRYFAIDAIDNSGNRSALSYETIYDTPRPAGTNAVIANLRMGSAGAGWDFSAGTAVSSNSLNADIAYSDTLGMKLMYATDLSTDIQDMGYASSLDAIDVAPPAGWSPTGSVEVIPGHCYVVWTRDNNFAKFRVTSVSGHVAAIFDWAYQTDTGNIELKARRVRSGAMAAWHPTVESR